MNILLVVASGFPVPAIKGGAFETLTEMLSNINEDRRKANITIVSAYQEEAEKLTRGYVYSKYLYFFTEAQKCIFPNNMQNLINKISLKIRKRVFFIDKNVNKCFDAIKYDKFDSIIIMGGNPMDFYKFTKKFGRDRMYFNLGGESDGSKYLNFVFGKFLCCSQFITDKLIKKGYIPFHNAIELRHAIDYDLFSKPISVHETERLFDKMHIDKQKTKLVFWGRISEVKGVKELIQSFIKMKNKEQCELLIIGNAKFGFGGESDYEKEVYNLAKSYKNIIFTGFIHRLELAKVLQACDIAVLPSLWEEPSGNVVPEAMSAGLATIITDSGGMVEYITTGTGIIIARDENLIENLSNKMDELVENDKARKQMGMQARQKAKDYDIVQYYNRLIDILKNDKNIE